MMGEKDNNGYKYYLGVLEGADIMQAIKAKIRREYLRRVKLVAKSQFYGGNLLKSNALGYWCCKIQCRNPRMN